MTQVRQWLDEVRLGRLSLGDLVARINGRGRIEDTSHLAEVEDLDALLRENKLDPRLYRAVKTKLAELQGATITRSRAEDVEPEDRTVMLMPSQLPAVSPKPADDDGDEAVGGTIISPVSFQPPPRSPTTTQTGSRPKPPASPPPDEPRLASPPADDEDEDGDATRMLMPGQDAGAPSVPPRAAPDDATQMLGTHELSDEGTRLLPADKRPAPPRQASITGSRTDSRTGSRTGSQTGSTSGTSGARSSSWRRLSEAEAPVDKVDVGSRLKDRFVLERKIGTGGMGVVFLALDERKVEARDRNPRVAVKVLNDEFRQHPDSLIALQRESRRSQQLAHDNIVRVYDFDKDGSIVFMTMEYVDGEDLKNLIRGLDGKAMPIEEAFPIIEGMGRALERAHREGVVHSDFKPGNVMLTSTRVPKVFDFGIARAGKQRAEASGEQTVFDAGTLGALTPAYASLEMLQGQDPEPQDDLYALGCVAYELLGGGHPFNKINAEQAMKQGLVPKRIPSLSKLQWRTLQRGLAFHRAERVASAAEFVEGLRPRTQREKLLPLIAAGAGGLVGLILLIWLGTSLYYGSRVAAVENCIGSAECTDAAVLMQRLSTLDAADQKRISDERRDEIKGVFHGSLARHWYPEQGRYDYTNAKTVVALAFDLYGADSAWVKELGDGLEAARNTQLSRLNDAFSARIEAGLYKSARDDGTSLLGVLNAVRAIDPSQPLLQDGRIAQGFERGVRDAMQDPGLVPAEQIDLAEKRLDTARGWLSEAALKPLESDLGMRRQQLASMAEEQQRLAVARAQRTQRLDAVAQALNAPADTAEWRTRIRSSWLAAREASGGDDRELAKLGEQLGTTLIAQSSSRQRADELDAAAEPARLGLELLPNDARLDRQFKSVSAARDQRIAQAATEAERVRLNLSRLDDLLERPVATTAWVGEIAKSLKAVAGKADPAQITARRDRFAQVADKLVGEALAADNFASADTLAQQAVQVDASDMRLAALPGKVDDRRRKALASQLALLQQLVRQSSFTPEWQNSLDSALAATRGAQDPSLPALLDQLGSAYAQRAEQLASDKSYTAARQLAEAGAKRVPQSAAVKAAQSRIAQLEQQDNAAREAEQRTFKIQELERTIALKSAAAELPDAITALQQLRKLDTQNTYANGEGPKQIAEGALKLAERFAAKNDWANAIKTLDRGLEVWRTSALTQARARYESAGCAADLERELQKRGSLAAARRGECLALLRKNDPRQYERYKSLERGDATPSPAPLPSPAPGTGPAAAASPAPVPAPVPAPEAEAEPNPVATGPDPCKKSFSGSGAKARGQCTDPLLGDQGPIIVVVSGMGTFGITQMEIANLHWAMYCRDSGACIAPNADHLLPVRRVGAQDAKNFARWLSRKTGRRYRLPTEAEWRHAATQGGQDPLVEGYCRSSGGDKVYSAAPRRVNSGVMNGWGLVNSVGNVREIVDNGGSFVAVGGSFEDETKDCDAEARRVFTGPDDATGFRLLRELDS